MSWIRIDDQMIDHPKIAPLSDAAFRWVHRALSYANRFPADGVLPAAFLDQVPPSVRRVLVARKVWERGRDGVTRIHDYLDYQPSKADVERERAQTRSRVAKWRATHQGSNAVTNGVSNAVSNGAPSRPGPSRPSKRRTPLPPVDTGGLRIRREHRENAKAILRSRQGYCQHEPRCANQAICLDLIAHELAQKGLAS